MAQNTDPRDALGASGSPKVRLLSGGAIATRKNGAAAPAHDWMDGLSGEAASATAAMLERVERVSEVDAPLSLPFLVKDWFYLGQTSLLFAPSNAGKTSLVLDLVGALTTDQDWHGHRAVRGGAVLYIAAEAPGSIFRRTAALAFGAKERIVVLGEPIDLVGDPEAGQKIAALVRLCDSRFGIRIKLTVVDTLTLCFGDGDENSTRDAKRVIHSGQTAARLSDTHFMLVHHTGKDRSAGPRGSYALEAGIDTVVELTVLDSEKKTVLAKARKQRDAEKDASFAFKVVSVRLGLDDEGEPITTSAIEALGETDSLAAPASLRADPGMDAVLAALTALAKATPTAPGFSAADIAEACAATFKAHAEPESRKKAVRGVLRQAMEAADPQVVKQGDRYMLAPMPVGSAA